VETQRDPAVTKMRMNFVFQFHFHTPFPRIPLPVHLFLCSLTFFFSETTEEWRKRKEDSGNCLVPGVSKLKEILMGVGSPGFDLRIEKMNLRSWKFSYCSLKAWHTTLFSRLPTSGGILRRDREINESPNGENYKTRALIYYNEFPNVLLTFLLLCNVQLTLVCISH